LRRAYRLRRPHGVQGEEGGSPPAGLFQETDGGLSVGPGFDHDVLPMSTKGRFNGCLQFSGNLDEADHRTYDAR
jgi:hypothetical protein